MDPAYDNGGSAASRKPIHCELVPVSPRVYGSFRLKLKPTPPPLVLDVATNGAIRVTEPNTEALGASTWLAEVITEPGLYSYVGGGDEGAGSPSYMQPLLVVDIPGLQPLRIGARPMGLGFGGGPLFRYGWRGSVRRFSGAEEPAYVVTEPEWLTLAENFGLGSRVVDESASGKMQRRDRRNKVKHYLEWALLIAVLTAVVIYHFVR